MLYVLVNGSAIQIDCGYCSLTVKLHWNHFAALPHQGTLSQLTTKGEQKVAHSRLYSLHNPHYSLCPGLN